MADIGITLRSARVQKGLTIDQVAQDTRISSRFLEALEDEAFEELPAPVYVRGFLRSYANYLHIDAQPLLDKLNAGPGAPTGGPDAFVGGPTPRESQAAAARRPGASNPFQRSAAQGRPAPPRAPDDYDEGGDELGSANADGWEPEAEAEPIDDLAPRARPHRSFDPSPLATYGAAEEDERYRQRRVAGVLLERDGDGPESSRPMRLLLIAAAGVVGLFVVLLLVVVFKHGGGSNNAVSPLATVASGRTPGQVIAVGSPSPSASVAASPGASGTAGSGPTAAGTKSATTATPDDGGTPVPTDTPDGTSTAAPTNTPAPTAAATATPAPPTATPAPPTPTPVPTATP
ncbi:MAG: helix-turn-helix domain-containing protein, partial [Tepidiformaceae bacterium]